MNQLSLNPFDHWQAIALSEDVNGQIPLALSIDGFELVAFRDSRGKARVVENRCPHRRVPLSLGKVINGAIRCAYHGWTFDGDSGQCIDVPNFSEGERVSPNYRVQSYLVKESQGFVYLWLGESEVPPGLPFDRVSNENLDLELSGSGTAPLSLAEYRAVLLDGPQALFEISGVRITDFYLGDVTTTRDRLVLDREAEWGAAEKPVEIKITDRPLILRTEMFTETRAALIHLLDGCENDLAVFMLAFSEGRRGTTNFVWRYRRFRDFKKAQPVIGRLKNRGKAPVNVFEKLDGKIVASLLVGPSFDLPVCPVSHNQSLSNL